VTTPAIEPREASATIEAHTSAWSKARRPVELLLAACALTPIVLFLIAALGRLRVPFPLEQLEGSMLLAAERVAHGLPIYVPPNFYFIPFMYAPAYYYITGWAVRLMGAIFLPLRLVSLVSVCASFAIIYVFVLLDGRGSRARRHFAALAGAGLYAAAYPWTRSWFDLGRVDSLYVFLLLVALVCTRLTGRNLHPLVAAAAWTLTFLAKQTIFPVAIVMLCHDWKRPRRLATGVAGFVAMAAIASEWLNHATNGWFGFYAFDVPRANADLLLRPAVFFLPSQILAPFGIAVLLIGIAWAQSAHERPRGFSLRTPAMHFYLLATISVTGLCWFLQAHGGAAANTPMPVYAVLAVMFGIAIAHLDHAIEPSCAPSFSALGTFGEPARVFLLLAASIPLISWVYNPRDVIPGAPSAAAHHELGAWLKAFPGDVYLPTHPLEGVLAGKSWHPGRAALHDALAARNSQDPELLAEIRDEVDQEKFDAIVLDGSPDRAAETDPWLPADLRNHYPLVGLVPGVSDWSYLTPHPTYFLLPCREESLAVARGWTILQTPGTTSCSPPGLHLPAPQPAVPPKTQGR
jgi:hypothetical protein